MCNSNLQTDKRMLMHTMSKDLLAQLYFESICGSEFGRPQLIYLA